MVVVCVVCVCVCVGGGGGGGGAVISDGGMSSPLRCGPGTGSDLLHN